MIPDTTSRWTHEGTRHFLTQTVPAVTEESVKKTRTASRIVAGKTLRNFQGRQGRRWKRPNWLLSELSSVILSRKFVELFHVNRRWHIFSPRESLRIVAEFVGSPMNRRQWWYFHVGAERFPFWVRGTRLIDWYQGTISHARDVIQAALGEIANPPSSRGVAFRCASPHAEGNFPSPWTAVFA